MLVDKRDMAAAQRVIDKATVAAGDPDKVAMVTTGANWVVIHAVNAGPDMPRTIRRPLRCQED